MEETPKPVETPLENNTPTAPTPVINPVISVITTFIITVLFAVFGGFMGARVAGALGFLIAVTGSLIVGVLLSTLLFRTKQTTSTGETVYSDGNGAAKATSIGFIVLGLVVGFIAGIIVSFEACYKSQCNPFEAGAPYYLPAASLLVTVPVTTRAFRVKNSGLDSEQKTPDTHTEIPQSTEPTEQPRDQADASPEQQR